MTVGKEWKLILLFTLPIMAGNILQQLYNIIDGIIVGNFVGELSFASVATSGPLVLMYLALAFGLSVGVGITVSQYFGAGKDDELPIAIDTALILLGVCGLIFTGVGMILSPHMLRIILNVPEEIFPEAVTYMRIYSAGLFFQFMYNCIASTLRGIGDSKATLYFLIVSAILNIILTFIFVITIKWGVAGAAFSTVLAQAVCATVSYIYLRKRFPFIKGGKHFDIKLAKTMIKLGLPIAVQMSLISLGNGAMQRLVNSFGVTTPAVVPAYGAAVRLDALVFVPMSGFQAGLASFTGQNIGAGKLERVRTGLRSSLVMAVLCTVFISLCYYIFAETIVGFFGLSNESLVIGTSIVRYFTFFFWILACNMMFSGVLQGAGDTVIITLATLTSLSTRVVLGYLAAHFEILGYSAAWMPVPLGWLFWATIIYSRYFSGKWKNKAVAGRLSHESN
jgi:putative MATE family efflux protein